LNSASGLSSTGTAGSELPLIVTWPNALDSGERLLHYGRCGIIDLPWRQGVSSEVIARTATGGPVELDFIIREIVSAPVSVEQPLAKVGDFALEAEIIKPQRLATMLQ
jgi:hypothetical protein